MDVGRVAVDTAVSAECGVVVSRKGWILFAVMCVAWGVPYLFIKIADGGVAVSVVVFARTALGAVVLLPLAVRGGQLRVLARHWRPLLAFAVLEIIGPWGLLSQAERALPSSLSGLLIAAVPIIGVVAARLTGGTEQLGARRWIGLFVGLAGVAVLAVPDFGRSGGWPMAEIGLVTIGYACAPLIAARKLADVPAIPLTAACLSLAALVYAPAAIIQWPRTMPSGSVIGSLVVLGLVCTAFAFVVFFQLIREAGTSRAMVITYVNPAIAVAAGVSVLGEPFTVGIAVSFALIIAGCLLATAGRGRQPVEAEVPASVSASS